REDEDVSHAASCLARLVAAMENALLKAIAVGHMESASRQIASHRDRANFAVADTSSPLSAMVYGPLSSG
ncbi:hypothetical protein HMPREF0591_5631, partial [Mycobacterium parascrofulaceum ATCC BAA-614]